MTLTPVEYLPDRAPSQYKHLDEFIESFLKMNVKYAKVNFSPTEYRSSHSARGSIHYYIWNRQDTCPIKACVVNDEVYLIRTDM